MAGWWGRAHGGKYVAFVNCVLFKVCSERWKHSLHVNSLVPALRMQGCYISAPYDNFTILVMSEEGIILKSVMESWRTEPFQSICVTGVHHIVSGFSEQTGRLAGAGLKYLLLFTLPGATGAQHSCKSVSRGLCEKIKVGGSDFRLVRKEIHGRGWGGVQLPGKGHPHLPFSLQNTIWFLQPKTWESYRPELSTTHTPNSMPDQIRGLQCTDGLVKKNVQLHKVGVGQQVWSNKPIS